VVDLERFRVRVGFAEFDLAFKRADFLQRVIHGNRGELNDRMFDVDAAGFEVEVDGVAHSISSGA
jgi:hypothetical protein